MHNHQVRGNLPPFGGHGRFRSLGVEQRALPTWVDAAGYNTVHVGKYLNGYGDDGNPQVPQGWDEWYGQVSDYDPAFYGAKLYYNYTLLEKGPTDPAAKLKTYGTSELDYESDVLQNRALEVLDRLGDESKPGGEKPFYLQLAMHAPHFPFVPAPRYTGTQSAALLSPLAGMNEKNITDKPAWLQFDARTRIKPPTIATLAANRRARLEQLTSIDVAVAAVINKLAEKGELDNTYVIFSSDNGYFFGEHRITAGKFLPYEPSARVPFAIRGPGIPAGGVSAELASNVDFAPTIAAITGATPTLPQDGRSLLPFAVSPAARTDRPLLLEGDSGPGLGQSRFGGVERPRVGGRGGRLARRLGLTRLAGVSDLEQEGGGRRSAASGDFAPPYRSIRTDRYLLTIYGTGDVELYDMLRDPSQLRAVTADPRYRRVKKVLLGRLLQLSFCQGASCGTSYGPDPKPAKGPKPKPKGAKPKK